jgi:hypothetical protein
MKVLQFNLIHLVCLVFISAAIFTVPVIMPIILVAAQLCALRLASRFNVLPD